VWVLTANDIYWRLVRTRRWEPRPLRELARRHARRAAPAISRTPPRALTRGPAPGPMMSSPDRPRGIHQTSLTDPIGSARWVIRHSAPSRVRLPSRRPDAQTGVRRHRISRPALRHNCCWDCAVGPGDGG